MPATRFLLIRHGETAWNAERRYQGQLDIALNAIGEAQARALAPALATLHFDAAYASPLRRAWRTAELALAGRSSAVLPAPTLRERHYGVFQGMTAAEASVRHPEAHAQYRRRAVDYDFESGESLREFAARVLNALADLATRHAGGTVVAVTHGGVLDIVHRAARGRDLAGPRDFAIPNAGINRLHFQDGVWRIEEWADTRHLTELARDEVTP